MEDESGILLHHLMRAHRNACMAALAERGLRDIGSPRLLLELYRLPGDPAQAPTQKELADRLHSAPPTIAASLKVLERQGYVKRWADQSDLRRNRISITDRGRDAISQGMDAFRQVDGYMYHGFTPPERELVQDLLRRMLENLYQIGGDKAQEGPRDALGPPPLPPDGPSPF